MANLKDYVAIEPYKANFDIEFTELELRTMFVKSYAGSFVDLDVQPVRRTESGLECMMMCFNPIDDGMTIKRIPMKRKNAKQMENMHKDFVGMKQKIADLWNKRDFESLKTLL